MATIKTINATDLITDSRADINDNFSALNSDKIETSYLDTDNTLAANSDVKIPSQKAVKAYVDAGGNVNASTTTKGIVEEATQAEVDARTTTGATGARLFVNPGTLGSLPTSGQKDALAGTSGTPSSSNKYVTNADTGETGTSKVVRTKSTGKLDNSIIANLSTSGITTYNLTTASGTQNIAHGLGVIPTKVTLTAMLVNGGLTMQSFGGYTSSGNRSMVILMDEGGSSSSTDELYSSTTYGIACSFATGADPYSGVNTQRGIISVDATNIAIAWTKNNSPTGTATIMWEAQY